MRFRAPGKLMWCGEYGVLEGGVAVVSAIDRWVFAQSVAKTSGSSPLLDALAKELGRDALGVEVDSSALLSSSGEKYGLGGSAATVVAATAHALGTDDVARILPIALAAHKRAQRARGAEGSGVDVMACAHGGTIAATRDGGLRSLSLPPGLAWVAHFSGVGADTPGLVAQVEALRGRDPDRYRRCLEEMTDSAEGFVGACDAGDAVAAISALARAGDGLLALGRAAEVPLVGEIALRLRAAAERHRGTAKPTGAGGGDMVLSAFPTEDEAAAFLEEVLGVCEHLPLQVASRGVERAR